MVRLRTKRFLNALNEYFFQKAQGGGLFETTAQKEKITNEVLSAGHAKAEGFRVAIVPGCVFLSRGKRNYQIQSPTQYYYSRKNESLQKSLR